MTFVPWPGLSFPGAVFEIEPPGIYQNSTLRFVKNLPLFPAQYWTLQYGLVLSAGQTAGPILFNSAPLCAGGNIQLVLVEPAVTKAWAPGNYRWQCFAQITSAGATALGLDASTRVYISTGEIVIFEDLTSVGAYDSRGKWQKIVDEIDAMILATAGDTQHEISIGRGTIAGQSIKGWTRADLIAFRAYAGDMAKNEERIRNRRGGAPNPRVKRAFMGGQGGAYLGANGFPDQIPFA